MKRCAYDIKKITTDERGRRHYLFPDGREALTGTDVSHYVGSVNWRPQSGFCRLWRLTAAKNAVFLQDQISSSRISLVFSPSS